MEIEALADDWGDIVNELDYGYGKGNSENEIFSATETNEPPNFTFTLDEDGDLLLDE